MYAVLMHYGRSSLLNSSYEWQERNLIWDQTVTTRLVPRHSGGVTR